MAQFDRKFMDNFAKKVVKVMGIGKKPNENGIKRAKKRFKWVKKILRKDRVSKKEIKKISGLNDEKIDMAIAELENPVYGPLLWKEGSRYKVKKGVGETVLISLNPQYEEFSKRIADEVRKLGAHAKISNTKTDDVIRYYKYATKESCAEAPEPFMSLSAKTDVYIGCTTDSVNWKEKVERGKLRAGAPAAMLRRMLCQKYGQRWVLIGLPFKQVAKEYRVPYSKFSKVLFESLRESFSQRTKNLVDFYAKKLSNKRVRITADDGTDLRLRCRRMLKDAGELDPKDPTDKGLNLPTGEAFTAPVENQTSGRIFFKRISPHGYGTIDNIWLEFEKGRLVGYKTSPKGMRIFKKLLDENTGGKLIAGELGIGCNRKAKFLNGFIIVDEKIFGSIHLAIGENVGYGGNNRSSLHFDMVKDMLSCEGRIWVGKKPVMDKGLPVGLRI